jgi:hypothetical protein
MYIAINKANRLEFHSFEWSEDNKLIVNGKQVSINDWDIIEVFPSQQQQILLTVNEKGLALIEDVNNLFNHAAELGVSINEDVYDDHSLIGISNCLSYIVSEGGVFQDEFLEKVGVNLDEHYLPYLKFNNY